MTRSLATVLVACAALIALTFALTLARVSQLEAGELEHESAPRPLTALAGAEGSTRVSARLTSVELRRGEHATFEVCSADRLEPARWRDALELVVFRSADMAVMLRVPLDAAHLARAKRGAHGACLPLGGGDIERSGRYTLDAVWPAHPPPEAVAQIALRARVLAQTPLVPRDRGFVIALFASTSAALLSWMLRRREPAEPSSETGDEAPPPRRRPSPALTALAAAGVPLLLVIALTQVPTATTAQTLVKGAGLVLLQALGPFALARLLTGSRAATLLEPPRRPWSFVLAALAAAALLVVVARVALELVPATSEAPIQSFVSWPSGMLCFAALGVLLPLGEELLFRGHVWAAVQAAAGRTDVAALTTYAAFVALHVQQSWGNWGGLLAIAVTGAVLTLLRIASGSVLVPALTHVLYNFALSLGSF